MRLGPLNIFFMALGLWLGLMAVVFSETPTNNSFRLLDYVDENRARENWMLNCQGCHKPNGEGLPDSGMPTLVGSVASFLDVPGGREYLGRVPGVINNTLSDEELAGLLNWLLVEFDPDAIPENFTPYSAEEVSAFRQNPLGSEAPAVRSAIVERIKDAEDN